MLDRADLSVRVNERTMLCVLSFVLGLMCLRDSCKSQIGQWYELIRELEQENDGALHGV